MFFTQLYLQFCHEKLMLPFAAEIIGISILVFKPPDKKGKWPILQYRLAVELNNNDKKVYLQQNYITIYTT